MNRRNLLKYLSVITASSGFNLGFQSVVQAAENSGRIDWGYVGDIAPENWGQLSSEFMACSSGMAQSPINIESNIKGDLPEIQRLGISLIAFNYQDSPLKILNDGHTIQVKYAPGSNIILDGQLYELKQFHFHHPSEHTINSQGFDMEIHLVHQNPLGSLAVLSVLIKEGAESKALQAFWQELPQSRQEKNLSLKFNAEQLLPVNRSFYSYKGSLTTPPCSEIVNWVIFDEPIQVSRQQIEQFTQVISDNARPIQAVNRRLLLKSR